MGFEVDPHAPPVMERLAPALPVAAALIGCLGALMLGLADLIGLPTWPAAILAVAVLVIATGAMHEDAVADLADSFGGDTIERKLAIMKDPTIGSFGATALVLVLGLRIALFAGLLEALGAWRAGTALVAASAVARIAGLWPATALAPARPDGLGATASELSPASWRLGAAIGAALSFLLALIATGRAASVLAPLAAFAAAWFVTRLADRQLGGQTGDVCGAATLLAELACLAVLLACAGT
jgi:adenosylcobinamide-GDP ribazoletransferase